MPDQGQARKPGDSVWRTPLRSMGAGYLALQVALAANLAAQVIRPFGINRTLLAVAITATGGAAVVLLPAIVTWRATGSPPAAVGKALVYFLAGAVGCVVLAMLPVGDALWAITFSLPIWAVAGWAGVFYLLVPRSWPPWLAALACLPPGAAIAGLLYLGGDWGAYLRRVNAVELWAGGNALGLPVLLLAVLCSYLAMGARVRKPVGRSPAVTESRMVKPPAVIMRSLGIGFLVLQLGLWVQTCLVYSGAFEQADWLGLPLVAALSLLGLSLPAADTVRARHLSRELFWLMVVVALAADASLIMVFSVAPSLANLVPTIFYPRVWAVIGWTAAVLVFVPNPWPAGRKAIVTLAVLVGCIAPLLWVVWRRLVIPGMLDMWAAWHIFGVPLVLVPAISNSTISRLYHRQAPRSAPDRSGPCPG